MIRLLLPFACASAMVFTAASLAQEPADKEREKLVGVWVGWAVKGKGENPERMGVKIELIITKDTIKGIGFQTGDRTDLGEGAFTINAAKAPFHLDGDKKLANPKRKEFWQGIYELDGDNLKWCVGRKNRPAEFDGKDDAFLLILKRQPKK